MAPLGGHHVDELLAACDQYARDRRELAAIVDELRVTFPPVRDALDQLAKLTSTARDRRQLELVVVGLQRSFPAVRDALNKIARLAAGGGPRVGPGAD